MHGSLRPQGNTAISKRRHGSWAPVCAAALGVMVLAACGSVRAAGSPAGSGRTSPVAQHSPAPASARFPQPALCRQAAAVTRLEVVRSHGFKVPELEPAFPNMVTVTNRALIRDVIRALCALPVTPPGAYHCPALLLGTAYTLRFSVGSRPLPLVTIESTGCQAVTGVGPGRRVTSEGFWRVLSAALGVKTPPVLTGSRP
jgi:hypothetical protein